MAAADASIPHQSLGSLEQPSSLELHRVFLNFYENGTFTDCKFQVECGGDFVTYNAHMLPLSIWSPVFEDMFYGSQGEFNGTVVINDVPPSIFAVMLRFMYGEVCEINRQRRDVNFVLKLYKAAVQYQIEALEHICRNNLAGMTPDKHNVFQLLDAAQMTNDNNIRMRCLHVLETRTAEVLANQENLNDVTQGMMMTILSLSRVSFSSEFELVMWVFAWAKNRHLGQSGRSFRNVLDDVLGLVDLTAMTAEDFGKLLANNSGVFSESEICKIFRNIVDPGCCDLPDWARADIERVYSYSG